MSEFYEIDSTRVSLTEYWWDSKSPAVLVALLLKWVRIRLPNSSDDPPVASTLPFVVEELPPAIAARFQPILNEFTGLGFLDPVYHLIQDGGTLTTIYWATLRHTSGHHLARLHHRTWQKVQKTDRAFFPMFLTGFNDGTFLVSSAGKPDFAAPATVQMNRMREASPVDLWAEHERLANVAARTKAIAPVTSQEEMLAASERHHVLVRDFHLARGVFRPRTTEEKARADAAIPGIAPGRPAGPSDAEVLAELDRLQTQNPGWQSALWVLLGSLVVFLAAGAAKWNWKFTLWIIPVLLFHELGHWVAMRLFHYRNLRMFFIPLFGAAVMGEHWNIPGWKKVLVSLAGPLPGIAVGVLLGIAGLVLHRPWLNAAALALLLLNGLNLLPILPLDGGHVLQATLFCRNRWLDLGFRILAMIGLIAMGMLGLGKALPFIAIPMLLSLPIAFRLAKVANELRCQPLPQPLPGEDRIPEPTAQAIISAVRDALPAQLKLNTKVLARHSLNVFETMNARPPGLLATACLLALHGGALLAAVLVGLLLVVDRFGGGLGGFVGAAARQPEHAFVCGDFQRSSRAIRDVDGEAKNRVVVTLPNQSAALAKFGSLTNQILADSQLLRFGDSLILTLPTLDDAAREQWFDAFQTCATNAFVAPSNAPVGANLTMIAPTLAVATNLAVELRAYFSTSANMRLIAPWELAARGSGFAAARQARESWLRIGKEMTRTWHEPALRDYQAKINSALKRGALGEVQQLSTAREAKVHEIENERRMRLRAPGSGVDPALVDLQARLQELSFTNRLERAALYRQLAGRLGEVAYDGEVPAPGADAYGVTSGLVEQHGLLINVDWVGFREVTTGLPALTEWLCAMHCDQIKYELQAGGSNGMDDEFEP